MASRIDSLSPVHFHIRWSGTGGLDYFRFTSREEADESAQLWVLSNETYSIEAFDGSCGECAELLGKFGNQPPNS